MTFVKDVNVAVSAGGHAYWLNVPSSHEPNADFFESGAQYDLPLRAEVAWRP